MFCQHILGNVEDETSPFASSSRRHDELEIRWWEMDRRALRKFSRSGREVRLLLPLGQALSDGDVLIDEGETIVVVRVAPAEVLVIRPRDMTEMGLVALIAGNLHAPAQVVDGEILIAPDGPIEAALAELDIACEREVRRFCPRRCAGMPMLLVSSEFEVRS
jgi:urease accessory protein